MIYLASTRQMDLQFKSYVLPGQQNVATGRWATGANRSRDPLALTSTLYRGAVR